MAVSPVSCHSYPLPLIAAATLFVSLSQVFWACSSPEYIVLSTEHPFPAFLPWLAPPWHPEPIPNTSPPGVFIGWILLSAQPQQHAGFFVLFILFFLALAHSDITNVFFFVYLFILKD